MSEYIYVFCYSQMYSSSVDEGGYTGDKECIGIQQVNQWEIDSNAFGSVGTNRDVSIMALASALVYMNVYNILSHHTKPC